MRCFSVADLEEVLVAGEIAPCDLKNAAQIKRWPELRFEPLVYDDGVIRVDSGKKQVFIHRQEVGLSGSEFRLLSVLTSFRGYVLSKRELGLTVWGNADYNEWSIRWHIYSLRKKIGDDRRLILTKFKEGYIYNAPNQTGLGSAEYNKGSRAMSG